MVIILDQFEEFFNYQRYSNVFNPFICQLAETIVNREINTTFVISMREDFALELNAFKPHLPTLLFENFYRLEKLTHASAYQAIKLPLEQVGFQYETGLLDILITDLSQREQIDRFGLSAAALLEAPTLVEPPHLQIVCQQLWEHDRNNPQKLLTQATYECTLRTIKNHRFI